jgi:hypothetical protein
MTMRKYNGVVSYGYSTRVSSLWKFWVSHEPSTDIWHVFVKYFCCSVLQPNSWFRRVSPFHKRPKKFSISITYFIQLLNMTWFLFWIDSCSVVRACFHLSTHPDDCPSSPNAKIWSSAWWMVCRPRIVSAQTTTWNHLQFRIWESH